MKILFISDNFVPETNAPATRTYEHCIQWKNKGADVTVVTCNPNYPKGVIYPGYKNKFYNKEIIDGITVIRVWSYMAENKGFIKRLLDFISFSITSFWISIFIKTDIIVATSPQFFTAITGFFLSLFKNKPWVFEVRDLWPESIVTVGAMKKNLLYDLLVKIEVFLYKRADHIVSVTNGIKSKIIEHKIPAEKISVFTNGTNLNVFSQIPKDKELLKELNLKDKFIVGYIGTHGMAHCLDFILESIHNLEQKNIHFLFVGDGAEKYNLIKKAESLGLDNVTFIDSVDKKTVVKYISILDFALVNLKKCNTFKGAIPSKIFENTAMCIPILLGVEGEAAEIISAYNAGICFEPEDKESFISALQKATISDLTLYKYGCKKLAEEYSREVIANNMFELFLGIVKNKEIL